MRAVGMAGRLGAVTAARLETNAEFPGERAHRRIGGRGDIGDGDRLIGAHDTVLPVLELALRRVRLHPCGGELLALGDDGVARRLERIAPDNRAARAVSAAAHRDLRGIALHIADIFEWNAKPFMHELREHGGVPLALRMRPTQASERSARL